MQSAVNMPDSSLWSILTADCISTGSDSATGAETPHRAALSVYSLMSTFFVSGVKISETSVITAAMARYQPT